MGNQVGTLQRGEPENANSSASAAPAAGVADTILGTATRLHRHYFPPAPPPPPEPLTPDNMSTLHVCQIRMCLRQILPEELVNPILDYAEVYTVARTGRHEKVVFDDRHGSVWSIADRNDRERHWIYLVSDAIYGRLPRSSHVPEEDEEQDLAAGEATQENVSDEAEEEVPEDPSARNPWKVKCIKVTTWSRDQGWTSEHHESDDPYDGSYTWFEIGVGREGEILPQAVEIKKNRRADRNVQQYEHELPLDSPVLRHVRRGDRLLLLAKARYPGWQNIVQMAEFKVYYGF